MIGKPARWRMDLTLRYHNNFATNRPNQEVLTVKKSMRIVCVVMLVALFLTTGLLSANAATFSEDFSQDVFANGSWTRNDGSVYVNTVDGLLHIGADGGYDDGAQTNVSLTLPATIESKMNLRSGGRNYFLPSIHAYFGNGVADFIHITYLARGSDQWGWAQGNDWGWSFGIPGGQERNADSFRAPAGEDQWVTVRAIIRADGGELQAKREGDPDFQTVATRTWSIPSSINSIRLRQPWDAVSDFDYVNATSGSTTPETVVTPFRANPNGYSFRNFGGSADMQLFQDVFGLKNIYDPLALLYYFTVFQNQYGKGQCYGMAVTASMLYRGSYGPGPQDFQANAQSVFDLTRDTTNNDLDEPLERHISKYFYFQFDPALRAARKDYVPSDFGNALDLIQQQADTGWTDPFLLLTWGVNDDGTGWGHTVNIEGYNRLDTVAILNLYDNNNPGNTTNLNAVFANPFFNFYLPNTNKVTLVQTALHEKNSIAPLWGLGSATAVSVASSNHTEISQVDLFGRQTGYTTQGYVADIPGSERIVPLTGDMNPDRDSPEQYYLPVQDYEINLINTSAGPQNYTLFIDGNAFQVDTSEPVAGAPSHLATNLDQNGFTYSYDGQTKPLMLWLYREISADQERVFSVSDTSISSGDKFSIAAPDDTSGLNVKLEGGARTYDLSIKVSRPGGETSVTISDISAPRDASQTIQVPDWQQPDSFPIFVVTTTDGGEEVAAFNTTEINFDAFLDKLAEMGDMRFANLIPSIKALAQKAPLSALKHYLELQVTRGRISKMAAQQIYACTKAMR